MFYCLFLGGHFNRGIGLPVGGAYVFERLSCCHLHSLSLWGLFFAAASVCLSFLGTRQTPWHTPPPAAVFVSKF